MAEEIVFKTRVDTGSTVKDVQNINKELSKTNDEVKQVDKSLDTVQKSFDELNAKVESGELSVRQLTKAVRDYATIAVQAGEDSPIGQEAIKKAGQLKDRLSDLQQVINNNANDGRNMQTALQLGQGVVAGYAVLQGAIGLVGEENKDLQKTLVKLQSAMAVLNGLEEIRSILEKESLVRTKATVVWDKIKTASTYAYTTAVGTSTGALKLMKIAMLALPIVAIIAGIVALISVLSSFSKDTVTASEANESLNRSFENSQKIMDRQHDKMNREIENRKKLMEARGHNAKTIAKIEEEGYALEEQQRLENIKAIKHLIDTKKRLHIQAINEGDEETAKSISDEIKSNRTKYLDLKALDGQYYAEKQIREAQANTDERKRVNDLVEKNREKNKKILEQERERLKNIKQLENDFLNELEVAENEYYDSLLSKRQKDEQDVNDYYFRLIQEAEKYGKDTETLKKAQNEKLALIAKEYTDKQLEDQKKALEDQNQQEEDFYTLYQETVNTAQQNEVNAINDKYFQLIETAKQYGLDTVELERQRQEAIKKLDQEATEKKIANVKAYTDASLSMLSAFNDLANQLDANKLKNDQLTEKQRLEIQKKAFNREKALKTAGVIVNTAEAVAKSIAISPATGGLPFSAFAVATGVAQLATIASTKFDGGGGSVNVPSLPSANSNNSTSGGQQQNTLGENSMVSSVGLVNNQTGIKVNVVDSEIKAVMDASNQVNVISTIGG